MVAQPVRRHQHGADAGVGIGVDDQHPLAVVGGQRLGQREDERRFSDAALGVHYGNGIAHAKTVGPPDRCSNFPHRKHHNGATKDNLWPTYSKGCASSGASPTPARKSASLPPTKCPDLHAQECRSCGFLRVCRAWSGASQHGGCRMPPLMQRALDVAIAAALTAAVVFVVVAVNSFLMPRGGAWRASSSGTPSSAGPTSSAPCSSRRSSPSPT